MTDGASDRQPASPQRRKLLIAGAYAAVSAAVISRLPHTGRANAHEVRVTSPDMGPRHARGTKLSEPPAVPGSAPQPPADHVYDQVISNGRVIDPDSGFDGVLNVGIDKGTITGFGTTPLTGRATIDATQNVVSPGFIDFLSYEPNTRGAWFKIGDGVTTNLGMHGMQQGVWADTFFQQYSGSCPVNFGGAFSDHWVRYDKLGLDVGTSATTSQISRLADIFEAELHKGWLGIDFEPEYTPGVTFAELAGLAKVAKTYGVPCFFHGRYSSYDKESQTVPEIIRVAQETGASVHVAHLPSTGGTWHIEEALALINEARSAGVDITACMYPYNFWATYLGSARFSDGWQQRYRISYNDLQVAGTTERLNSAAFPGLQSENKLTVAYAIPESTIRTAIKDPHIMIGSDAILDSGNNHPRATGCFSRVLGRYVRDLGLITLPEALAKMTILPARRLEAKCPQLQLKGRLQRGADADICIFDPATVSDKSTVPDPEIYSAGISYVLIAGTVVKDHGGIKSSILKGQPIKSVLQA